MSFLTKPKKMTSSRNQIHIKEVKDGVLVLPHNRYCLVLETSSVNFELKSEEEQDVILEGFQNFLNSLPSSLQILVRVREVDVESYLNKIQLEVEKQANKLLSEQASEYSDFIQKLVSGNKILSRRFFLILPFSINKPTDFSLIKEQLFLNRDIVVKGLEKVGMKVKTLDSIAVIDLFYSFYNPSRFKIQDIRTDTVREALRGSYGI